MKLTEICRESAAPVIEFTEPMSSLAQEAQSILGYSRLKEEQDKPKESNLISRLGALSIDTLREADVKKYQKEQLIERTKERLQEWSGESHPSQFIGPGWRKEKINEYRLPIPEFVLNKAIQIKRELPEVVILIESLTDYPDPFLVVAIPHEKYDFMYEEEVYVEVWEEPKFEGRI